MSRGRRSLPATARRYAVEQVVRVPSRGRSWRREAPAQVKQWTFPGGRRPRFRAGGPLPGWVLSPPQWPVSQTPGRQGIGLHRQANCRETSDLGLLPAILVRQRSDLSLEPPGRARETAEGLLAERTQTIRRTPFPPWEFLLGTTTPPRRGACPWARIGGE